MQIVFSVIIVSYTLGWYLLIIIEEPLLMIIGGALYFLSFDAS
jgi:hypothetical protein